MMAEHKHAAVLRAIADGRDVQWRSVHMGHWNELSVGHYSPITHQDLEWRIKPEPKPDLRFYGVATTQGNSALVSHIGQADSRSDNNLRLTFDGETGKLKSAEVLP